MNAQPERQPRRHFSGADKVAILKRHLINKVPVSDLCDELGLQVNQFYQWQDRIQMVFGYLHT